MVDFGKKGQKSGILNLLKMGKKHPYLSRFSLGTGELIKIELLLRGVPHASLFIRTGGEKCP